MRLTLRTLLAYQDDILPAAQAKEIGARVSESSYASALSSRIRDVMRRRGVPAPEIEGPGSSPDPNLVAEYLDNTLSPKAVTDLERVLLDSDSRLAEVASSHQILTLVLGEPVEIPQELRERMYALVAAHSSGSLSDTGSGTIPTIGSFPNPPAQQAERPTVPEYLKRPPLWRRPKAAILGVSTVLICTYAYWSDLDLNRSHTPSSGQVVAVPKVKNPLDSGADPGNQEPAIPENPDTDIQIANPIQVVSGEKPAKEMPAEVAALTPAKPEVEPEIVPPKPPVPANPVPEVAPKVEPKKPALAAAKFLYPLGDGVMLYQSGGDADWKVFQRRTPTTVQPGDRLAVPEPFEQTLILNNAVTMTMIAGGDGKDRGQGCRLDVLPPSPESPAVIRIDRGRVTFQRFGRDPAPPILLIMGQNTLLVEMLVPDMQSEGDTLFGAEVALPQAMGHRPGTVLTPEVGLYVANGSVKISSESESKTYVKGASWTSSIPSNSTPAWVFAESRTQTGATRTAAKKFSEKFSADQTVEQGIPSDVKDLNETQSQFAALTLGLTDNIHEMVKCLVATKHEKTVAASINGLRQWLPRAAENDEILKTEIALVFADKDMDAVHRLLWGLTEADAANPTMSRHLLDWLLHSDLCVRVMAYQNLQRLTGNKKWNYNPLAPDPQLRLAVNGIEEQLRRNNGAILPKK